METNTIITLIGYVGLGAILKSFVDARIIKKQNLSQKQHEFKETRYKALIMLMVSVLEPEENLPNLKKYGRDFNTHADVLEEIKAELRNMILFASDDVIVTVKQFILNANEQTYYDTTIKMRKDLYNLDTKLRARDLLV